MRNLRESNSAIIDLTTVLMIGIAFAALMVIAYIIWTVKEQLLPQGSSWAENGFATDALNKTWNDTYLNTSQSIANVTGGFDDAVNLLLIAVTIFILAIAIGALLMLRGRQ